MKLGQGHRIVYAWREWEENYYAMFDTHSYYHFRETHLNARLNVKSWQSQWSAKSRSTAPRHSACLKSMSRTITIQGLTHSYRRFREIYFTARLDLNNAKLDVKSWQSHSSTKPRSRVSGHSACLKCEYVEVNYYARFDTHSYHRFRDIHFTARLDVNNARRRKIMAKSSSTKCRSRALVHSACLKSMSRTITMQGLTHSYHRFGEIHFNARPDVNNTR